MVLFVHFVTTFCSPNITGVLSFIMKISTKFNSLRKNSTKIFKLKKLSQGIINCLLSNMPSMVKTLDGKCEMCFIRSAP